MKNLKRLLFVIWLFQIRVGMAQSRTWELGVLGGVTYNLPTSLKIYQEDLPAIKLKAQYITEPFQPPVYYDIRLSRWQDEKGWGLKFTHHKLILTNLPPEVQRFSITDGFNLLTFNRLWKTHGLILSAGAGVVITHPESTIRNKPFPENQGLFRDGYYISGPTAEMAIAKQYYFAPRWFVLGETRLTGSWVRVPITDGHADVTNVSLHLLAGVGFKIKG